MLSKPEYLRAKRELMGFMSDCPEFAEDIIDLIGKNMDHYFISKGFSLRISAVLKMMVNPRSQKIYCNVESRREIEQNIKILASDYGSYYDLFVEIIRKYAWSYQIGYCALAKMIVEEHLLTKNWGDLDVL